MLGPGPWPQRRPGAWVRVLACWASLGNHGGPRECWAGASRIDFLLGRGHSGKQGVRRVGSQG